MRTYSHKYIYDIKETADKFSILTVEKKESDYDKGEKDRRAKYKNIDGDCRDGDNEETKQKKREKL